MNNNYVVITDSNSELPLQFAKEHNVDYVPMPYVLTEDEIYYQLGEHTDFKNFYDTVRAGTMPRTSTYPPQYYIDKLTSYLEDGKDILFVSFSSQLSSAFNYLNVACSQLKEKYPDRKIYVVDSKRISAPMALYVMDVYRKYEEGMEIDELYKWAEENKLNYKVYFMVDDINHLKRGGRISPAVAAVGTMLSIKPILTESDEGEIVKFGSEKGSKKAISKIISLISEEMTDDKCKEVLIVHADNPKDAEAIRKAAQEKLKCKNILVQHVGPVIGTHCGPGTLALAYKAKK